MTSAGISSSLKEASDKLYIINSHGRSGIDIYCSCTTNQEVQYFCDNHQDVVCDTCKHMKHLKCEVSRIQDKSSSYSTSKINALISRIKALYDDCDQLKTIRNADTKSLACSIENCKTEIKAFRNELDMIFDDLEKSMLNLLETHDEDQKRIGEHILTITTTLKTLQTNYRLSIHPRSRIDAVVSKIKTVYDDCDQLMTKRMPFERRLQNRNKGIQK